MTGRTLSLSLPSTPGCTYKMQHSRQRLQRFGATAGWAAADQILCCRIGAAENAFCTWLNNKCNSLPAQTNNYISPPFQKKGGRGHAFLCFLQHFQVQRPGHCVVKSRVTSFAQETGGGTKAPKATAPTQWQAPLYPPPAIPNRNHLQGSPRCPYHKVTSSTFGGREGQPRSPRPVIAAGGGGKGSDGARRRSWRFPGARPPLPAPHLFLLVVSPKICSKQRMEKAFGQERQSGCGPCSRHEQTTGGQRRCPRIVFLLRLLRFASSDASRTHSPPRDASQIQLNESQPRRQGAIRELHPARGRRGAVPCGSREGGDSHRFKPFN